MNLEEVRQKLGWAIIALAGYAKDKVMLELVLKDENMTAKFFAAVREAIDSNTELCKRFNAPINYE